MRLSNYFGCYKIFILSKTDETSAVLINNGKNIGQLKGNKLIFLPDNEEIILTADECTSFENYNEYDVLEINQYGAIFTWYSDSSNDCYIALTQKCNSNCIMCPASENERKNRDNLAVNNLKTIINYLPDDLSHLTITGGEPTLIGENNFIDIYKLITEHLPNTRLLLLTNGRTFGDIDFWERFSKLNTSNLRIAIPLHGSTPEKHDKITQANNSFVQTLRGLRNIINSGIESEIRIVVNKSNQNDLLEIAKLIESLYHKVNVVHFIGLEMRGNCVLNSDSVIISYEEAFNSSRKAINYLLMHGIDVELYNFPLCMIDHGYWSLAQQSISAYKNEYEDECSNCKMKTLCCGFFSSTKRFYKPKVVPIKEL